ncbi:cytochrome c oxidase assembly protein COX20, mitochondrial [Toxorhynchites rutilus septentrionalis]|uniref:cytochrome c oxidase assembly protein COX20, mitochondrial n=1 Tax=Toxorhynchites rutilus septentrionalis TaxID=329112 RepID=UPI00247B269E|nr:cytochrome c oxidase assembly protein COX20, mitochondrial [Toxorhynchites rutilus septentrionalis]XP_055642816.1 cytochrome c oxidase assembly protein COX20, mitochondrial [Toxorhynchites rutilus septentrionalis]
MDKKRVDFDELLPDPVPERGVVLFGRDLSQIPCFRNSFLYGIGTGVATGFLAFLGTSRPQLSSHIGFSGFMATTLCYWFACRYNWSKKETDTQLLQTLIQQQAMYEGTQKERDLDKKAESA